MIPRAHHPHDADWLEDQFGRLPRGWRGPVAARYARAYRGEGRRAANDSLRDQVEAARGYLVAADDAELIEAAEQAAHEVMQGAGRWWVSDHLAWAERYARAKGVTPPDPERFDEAGRLARLKCPQWWRRALRRDVARRVEQAARGVMLVHKRAGIYSSDEVVFRRRQQKRRNLLMLREMLAVNELGEFFTLEDLAALSVSNPEIRRTELMVRMRGFEEVADGLGHAGEFITITCPSRFHRATEQGGRVVENQAWDGSTPREAHAYLNRVWARIRAALHRRGIRPYGFRVAEPHHDGCPHWHLLLFMPADQVTEFEAIARRYALEDSPDEPGARRYRVKFVKIDKRKGTAAGYIAKYVAKNIDGHAIGCDLYGNDAIEAAERIDAWAACWGIRQFQQIGGPPVTVWRELRRIEQAEGAIEAARKAADAGDWAAYVRAQGGPQAGRMDHPVRVAYVKDVDKRTGMARANRYGEEAPGRVVGVQAGGVVQVTRLHEWTIQRKPPEPKAATIIKFDPLAATRPAGRDRAGAAGAAWTGVNNCTRHQGAAGGGGDSPPGSGPPGGGNVDL